MASFLTELGQRLGLVNATPQPTMAPPLSSYPSPSDAQYAIEQGYGYGTGNEPYIEGKRAQIYDRPMTGSLDDVMAAPSSNTDLTQFKNLDETAKIKTLYAQAALAANRSAIAMLGFDPQRAALQTKLGRTTVAGAYEPEADRMFVNVSEGREPSTLVHESIHRGLEQLRNASPEAAELIKKFPNEEYPVRYLMAKTMGDPEKGTGTEADRQRARSLDYFFNDAGAEVRNLQRLEQLAADMRKNRRPGGPR